MRSLILVKTVIGANWAKEQARKLVELGVDIHVVAPSGDGLMEEYREFGAHTHVLQTDIAPLARSGRVFQAGANFRALITEVKPDLIHSHFVGTTLFMRLMLGRRNRIPRLFQVPGPLHLENPLVRRVEIRSARPQDYWAASCRATRDIYLGSGIAPDRVGISYYGLDLSRFGSPPPLDLRSELGLGAGAKLVGMVAFAYEPKRWLGQRVGLKGHEDLIDAAAILIGRGIDLHCVFVGDAWGDRASALRYFEGVKAYGHARLGDRAHFLGRRSDVASLYGNFDVAVHPSHSENLGGAAESLLLGVPTVATNVGGFPDIVIDGKTGWLAPPKDPRALSMAIEAALKEPVKAHRMAAAGTAVTRQLLKIDATTRSIFDIYERMVAQKGLAPPAARSDAM